MFVQYFHISDQISTDDDCSVLCFRWLSYNLTDDHQFGHSFSIKMDNHQTLTDSLLGPQDREQLVSQTPGPVTIQPTEAAFCARKSDSFPCLQPLSLHQQAQGDVHDSGEVVVVIKQKTTNGSSVIFLLLLVRNASFISSGLFIYP